MIHLVGQLAELGVQGFQAVGGLEAAPQSGKEPETMEGQRLLEAFIQAGDGRDVEAPQFLTKLAQSRPGLGIRRALVGLLQPPTPGRLLRLREISHHVLALVPLTPLNEGLSPEHRLNGFAQPLGPVDDAEQARLHPQPTLHQCPQECRTDRLVLGGRLDESQDLLLPLQRDSQGEDHRILRKRLAVEDHGHELVPVQAPLTEGLQVAGAGPDKAAGDARRAQPKGGGGTASAQALYCRQVRPTRIFLNKPASAARGHWSCSYVVRATSRFAAWLRTRGTAMGSF